MDSLFKLPASKDGELRHWFKINFLDNKKDCCRFATVFYFDGIWKAHLPYTDVVGFVK
jgi:hypothetical protein